MTRNQIAYFEASEKKRSNLRNEELQAQANAEQQRHNYAQEIETNRSNVVSQQLGFSQLSELKRHNTAQEFTDRFKADETQRHNYVMEMLSRQEQRQNYSIASAQLAETQRANRANESIKIAQIGASIQTAQIAADATRYAANLNNSAQMMNIFAQSIWKKAEQSETRRHNKEMEKQGQQKTDMSAISTFGAFLAGAHPVLQGPQSVGYPFPTVIKGGK